MLIHSNTYGRTKQLPALLLQLSIACWMIHINLISTHMNAAVDSLRLLHV